MTEKIEESNITLNFSDNNFFRFEDCSGYKALSAYSFKEMDACWFDEDQNTLWLFELKDFTKANLAPLENLRSRADNLVKKAVDSLNMLLSIKHSYSYSQTLKKCTTDRINNNTIIKFTSIIHCTSSQKPSISHINDLFRRKFTPYAKLFDINYYSVIEHSRAINLIPNHIVG
ncbi:hypothetical protein [Echinicola rosea]|uniref:Uncharacterized protein n=1 Tax=Echinicola rosea TaxID=1807691 RepID=A0ABQ1ULS1_9BACT|nr:hypothetical protein [Echinicola rosea]GGF21843.1 hypothetical protein GCM10011339_07400 [Echinicola rosea]